jgi:hypothetical protein
MAVVSPMALRIRDWNSRVHVDSYRYGSADPVHFDYVESGEDLASENLLAFQKLWNKNNPNDKVVVVYCRVLQV